MELENPLRKCSNMSDLNMYNYNDSSDNFPKESNHFESKINNKLMKF